jgi:hypothetical protein
VLLQSKTDLLEVVRALRPPSRLASLLDRGQEQRHQDANNGNYDQKLDEREARSSTIRGTLCSAHLPTERR